jgi:GT2 family glycosyltransferase
MIPYYSLIVLAYNNWAFTKQCLISLIESLEEAHIQKGVEIIVVDNGSNMETKKQMNDFGKKYITHPVKLEFVMLEENLGYPSGINIGIGHSEGEIIAVLNNDLLFPPKWLSPLVDVLESNPLIGFAAPFLSYAGKSVQHVGKTFDTIEEMEAFAAYFTNLNKPHLIYADKIIGACLIFRRDLLVAIGGNDFWYGIGNFDDVDWCIRARLAGYTIAVVGGSFVHHIGHASFIQDPVQFNSSLQINLAKFERKWRIKDPINDPKHDRKTIKFEREKHYIPTQISEFSSVESTWIQCTSSTKSLLLCADWSNPQSQWPAIFSSLLSKHEHAHIYCWIPSTIYDVNDIDNQLHQLIVSSASQFFPTTNIIKVIHEEIPYTAVLSLIRSADGVVKVPEDFVNRYILHLAEQIGMKIV